MDELAHTNAPGSRHAKRWQDVRELLSAGISVWTTLNVQHLESLNDVVAQITGVTVSERVPDSVFEEADEVELVDLPADDLIKRLKEGRVYFPQLAEQALENFFRPGNLIALRELALRGTADRVDVQMQRYRRDHAVGETWPTVERVLVCLGPSPYGQHLVRAARTMATRLKAEWFAVYVETPAHGHLPPSERDQVERTLRLAEQLGGKAVTLSGSDTADEILAFARSRNVSKIVLGKPPANPWWRLPRSSFVDHLIGLSGRIDVYIIGGTPEERLARARKARKRPGRFEPYLLALAVVAVATLVSALLRTFVEPVNLAMVYLLGVALAATRFGRGPSVLASVVSVAIFDFFFIPPYLTFAVRDSQYLITFAVMLAVALLTSNLASRVRLEAERAREAQRRSQSMVDLTQDLARGRDPGAVARATVQHLYDHYGAQSAVFLPDGLGDLQVTAEVDASFATRTSEASVARWVFEHRQAAGLDTDTLPGSDAMYLPIEASEEILGVAGIRFQEDPSEGASERLHRMEAVVGQAALALQRAVLAERARRAEVTAESERLRSTLLSSVSHDFRTPLASIVGASSTLAAGCLDQGGTRELAQSIYDESLRLSHYVANLLDMTRLESGTLTPNREWQPLEEVVGAALERTRAKLANRSIQVKLPDSLPMVFIDGRLMEQVFINLLENVARHTPEGTPLDINVEQLPEIVSIRVEDRGPGLPTGEEERLFDKFYRASAHAEGAGLGLAICRAILEAHGGTIRAENRAGGGASFILAIPSGTPPRTPAPETGSADSMGDGT